MGIRFDNLIATELVNSWMSGTQLRVTALKTSYTYDAGNRILSEISQNPTVQWNFSNSLASQSTTVPTASVLVTVANLEAYALGNAPIINTPLSSTSNRGLITSYNYFGTTNEVSVTQTNAGTDPRVTKLTLDTLDRVTKSVTPAPVTGNITVAGEQLDAGGGYVTRFEYDIWSNPTKVIDALNNQTVTPTMLAVACRGPLSPIPMARDRRLHRIPLTRGTAWVMC